MLLVRPVSDADLTRGVYGSVFDVVDGVEELALLAVHVWFVAGGADEVEDAGGFAEDAVHFFEGAAGGFGIEEVGDGEDECIAGLVSKGMKLVSEGRDLHDCENDIGLVTNIVKSYRGNHDNEEVEDPIGRSRQCVGRSTNL